MSLDMILSNMLRLLIAWFTLLGWVLNNKVAAQSTTTSSAVPTHTVSVGIAGLQFSPTELTANASDVIGIPFAKEIIFILRIL